MFEESHKLLESEGPGADVDDMLAAVGFSDRDTARRRLLSMCPDQERRQALSQCLPMLLSALSEAATPDGSLINFERFVQSIDEPAELFRYLSANPRAVEILVKLFVGSQFLTEILLRHPDYLEQLTQHKRLAEIKSRQEFVRDGQTAVESAEGTPKKLDALRRFQRWELLRIGACDSFGLLDMKSVTVQLSLLADSLVQLCLELLAEELDVSPDGFAVLAFGKLGGEELNYSSDIDLVFLADQDATRFWGLGQKLIKVLMEASGEGFLYRVDMRLRPWGRSGALVNTVDAHVNYLKKSGMHWEKQALLKARVIAGDHAVGAMFLRRVEPLIYSLDVNDIRDSIRDMKERIEAELERQGRKWGEVKSGEGSIRDIEFVTQCLQLVHGGECPEVRSFNTLDALVRLADFGFLHGNEYRELTTGYVFLRKIEHSLQLMHHKQTHSLPDDRRELAYLARRLDYPNADEFLAHYRRHCDAVRSIYDRYIGNDAASDLVEHAEPADSLTAHLARMEPSYSETFSEEEVGRHVALLEKLSESNVVEVEAKELEDGNWQVTIVGFNHVGNLSMICGLLFVYGFHILEGNAFTDLQVLGKPSSGKKSKDEQAPAHRFVDVFVVRPPLIGVLPEVWNRYHQDLDELTALVVSGRHREAQGQLAKRVGGALRASPDEETSLFAVEIEIDNETSERTTVLEIHSEDTTGFLYELANALALAGIDTIRLIVATSGNRVFDTLYVTDIDGEKIVDPDRQQELRAAVVLIKHFTHLLPRSPNPEAALLRFRDFLEQLFDQPDWLAELASLERTEVLDALSRLLGVSSFLWEDFLRLQHANLFPVVRDVEALEHHKPKSELQRELRAELAAADENDRPEPLNAFKDREMFRTDMRHIMGHVQEFGQFSAELTDLAEVIVESAYDICDQQLRSRYGQPRVGSDRPCPLSICALGKCGGRELGFASDIELMFVYEDGGTTSGPESITTFEYFQKLVEQFTQTIRARREGIFQIDLRLRPYGQAGSLAVGLDAFENYFGPEGAAWPYERQALVKLRPVAGNDDFGERIVRLRDSLVYTGEPFDAPAMLAMREKQLSQLVKAATFHAKLSPGGLVDVEYLVQGLQITHGKDNPSLRATNTRTAMTALSEAGIVSDEDHRCLEDAYVFQRQLIDALRMVRGNAKDLTLPPYDSEEFEYLARRLGYHHDVARLKHDLEHHTSRVQDVNRLLIDLRAEGGSKS